MYQAEGNKMAQTANANYTVVGAGMAAKPQTSSEGIIERLNSIRMNIADARSSANSAADKIVGSAPTPINNSLGKIEGDHPPACCFIDALQQVIGDIENIGNELQEHLSRLHRSF